LYAAAMASGVLYYDVERRVEKCYCQLEHGKITIKKIHAIAPEWYRVIKDPII